MISKREQQNVQGLPVIEDAAIFCKVRCIAFGFGLLPKNWAMVAGNTSKLEAKIGGMTPAMLSLNGRCVLWPCIMRRPTWRFA
jgi:hypothetical protein